jgi:1-deoxy-D-xylulose 5-phosphate reductoisomerase
MEEHVQITLEKYEQFRKLEKAFEENKIMISYQANYNSYPSANIEVFVTKDIAFQDLVKINEECEKVHQVDVMERKRLSKEMADMMIKCDKKIKDRQTDEVKEGKTDEVKEGKTFFQKLLNLFS